MTGSLAIGVVSEADPNDHTNPTTHLLRRLRDMAQEASERHPGSVRVQFIVYVPGPDFQPDFEGVRLGAFSRARNQLNVLIGIPAVLQGALDQFLARSVQEGWRLAEDYLTRKGLGDSVGPAAQATAEVLHDLSR